MWSRDFLTFGKKICMVLKTAFCVSTRFFWGKNAPIKTLIPYFFGPSAENFSKFREIFCGLLSKCNLCFQRILIEVCQTCNLRDRKNFLMKCFFEKTSCLYNFSQSWSGIFLVFCPFFWQVCIQRANRTIPRKNVFSKKQQLCLWFLSHKKWIPRSNAACLWKLPPRHPEEQLEQLFLIMYLVA